jgi:type IV secretion system protein VirB8
MFRKKKESQQIDNAVTKSVNFEVSVAELARRSEKRAWVVAFFSLVMCLIVLIGAAFMMPLKEKVPYMVLADPYTGTASVAKLRGDYETVERIGTSEALNRANIGTYVMARESYDYEMWNLRDWNQTFAMSAQNVALEYRDYQDPKKNPNAPNALYGTERSLRIKIMSITPKVEATPDQPFRGSAAVRFQRSVYNKRTGLTTLLDNKLATMEFTYNPDLVMSDEDLHLNPLGFQVTAYRLDNDFSGSQPVAAPPENLSAVDPSAQAQPGQGQPVQGQPAQGQPMQGQPMQGQPMQGQPVQGQPMQGQPVQGQPMQGQPMQGQPMQGQPMQGQPMQGQPMQGQPTQQAPQRPAGSAPQQQGFAPPGAQQQFQPAPAPAGQAPTQSNGARN